MPYYGYDFVKNPVEFVKASKISFSGKCSDDSTAEKRARVGLSGEEAKNFYEDILKSFPEKNSQKSTSSGQKLNLKKRRRKKNDVKPSVSSLSSNHLTVNSQSSNPVTLPRTVDLFKAAEAGSLSNIQKILETRVIDVDATDQYGWTALMMASHQGHEDVVKFFLVQGAAWEDKIDGSGYDAYDLACLSGHDRIAHMLTHRKLIVKAEVDKAAMDTAHRKVKKEKLWCEICEVQYNATSDGNEKSNDHHSSISHQFCHLSKEDSTSHSSFYITPSNKGFKLLRNHGWDGNSGLGPSSSGRKYPIKTVLKRDRSGLGSGKEVARVTHFNAGDNSAVKPAKRAKFKHLHKKREEKFKNLEIDFRRSFYE